jgi:hypothetical protein
MDADTRSDEPTRQRCLASRSAGLGLCRLLGNLKVEGRKRRYLSINSVPRRKTVAEAATKLPAKIEKSTTQSPAGNGLLRSKACVAKSTASTCQ